MLHTLQSLICQREKERSSLASNRFRRRRRRRRRRLSLRDPIRRPREQKKRSSARRRALLRSRCHWRTLWSPSSLNERARGEAGWWGRGAERGRTRAARGYTNDDGGYAAHPASGTRAFRLKPGRARARATAAEEWLLPVFRERERETFHPGLKNYFHPFEVSLSPPLASIFPPFRC